MVEQEHEQKSDEEGTLELRNVATSDCVFRSMPATSSGACRAMIPVHVGPPFRSMPAGGCDAG
jgi:hypothetical protein